MTPKLRVSPTGGLLSSGVRRRKEGGREKKEKREEKGGRRTMHAPSSGNSVMNAMSCQNGARGLPSCNRDWALKLSLRSLNWGDRLTANRTKFMSWPMLGGSSSSNFRETWMTSLGRREGVSRLLGLSCLRGVELKEFESPWWGPGDLPAFSFCRAFRNTCLSWREPRRVDRIQYQLGQADPGGKP